jgi:hypothetical protein
LSKEKKEKGSEPEQALTKNSSISQDFVSCQNSCFIEPSLIAQP